VRCLSNPGPREQHQNEDQYSAVHLNTPTGGSPLFAITYDQIRTPTAAFRLVVPSRAVLVRRLGHLVIPGI
jgi:hypothetical protein